MKTLIFKPILIVIVSLFLASNMQAKTIYYVKENGTGDGTSWTNAAGSIQAMIDKATSGNEVWIAKGTYYPTTESIARDTQSRSFILKDGVNLFGGFSGIETAISQRLLSDMDRDGKVDSCEFTNKTILSGDIDGVTDVWSKTINSDGTWKWTVTGNSGNCYQVVTCNNGFVNITYFDGFTVTGGNGNIGAGIYALANLYINKCVVNNCNASLYGGGISVATVPSLIKNCIVTECSSLSGGGIDGDTVRNCVVSECYGGGIDAPTIKNCSVNNCFSLGDGGGVKGYYISGCNISNCKGANGGGIYFYNRYINDGKIDNCSILNCSATTGNGGGIYIDQNCNVRKCQIDNCTVSSNLGKGGGIFGYNSNKIENCIISNCSAYFGGGIHGEQYNYATNCTITNCTATNSGGGIISIDGYTTNCLVSNCYCISSSGNGGIYSYQITNCAATNNKAGTSLSNIGGTFQSGNISPNINTNFIHPTSFVGASTSDVQKLELVNSDWHLKEGSACINMGTSNTNYVSSTVLTGTDYDSKPRVSHGHIDIGAYEYVMPTIQLPATENFDNFNDWNNSEVFYNSAQINGGQNLSWVISNKKATFNWQTNITSSYNQPIFTYQIDATNLSKVFLNYDMYYQAYSGSISPLGTEKLNVEYSKDLFTWTSIATYSNANGTIANKTYKYDLSDQLAGNKFFIRFNANGVNSNRIEKWEIDNVIINSEVVSVLANIQEHKYMYLLNNGNLFLKNLNRNEIIELYDINGILLNKIFANSETIRISIPKRGVYIVKVTEGINIESEKIIW